ncbi:uncharacterized protein HaLaN_18283 [Haematococcus lacustris]|uniref:Uncharacterized protein n=1 Tax=Haematococcus lacustris TaxID=44745 RepID=A0A699ZEN2_HAELA|nr:uncharacterized protein HaLaN_18283 [Haematococcus lacustris]
MATVSSKVLEYERFVNDVLKEDLRKSIQLKTDLLGELKEYEDLEANLLLLQREGLQQLKSQVELGMGVRCEALVPDTSNVFINIVWGDTSQHKVDGGGIGSAAAAGIGPSFRCPWRQPGSCLTTALVLCDQEWVEGVTRPPAYTHSAPTLPQAQNCSAKTPRAQINLIQNSPTASLILSLLRSDLHSLCSRAANSTTSQPDKKPRQCTNEVGSAPLAESARSCGGACGPAVATGGSRATGAAEDGRPEKGSTSSHARGCGVCERGAAYGVGVTP